jgi:hypothetical protein
MRTETRMGGNAVGGLFLIGVGILLLVGQFLSGNIWHYLWPFFIIGFGMLFFAGMLADGRRSDSGALAIPGSIITTLGLIFLYQTLFNHWTSWAYIWSLMAPTSVGVGLIIFGWWSDRPQLYKPGWILIVIGLCIFVVLGGFFELILGLAGIHTPGRIIWPLMLIVLGLFLALRGSFRWLGLLDFRTETDTASPVETSSSSSAQADNTGIQL